MAIMELVKGLVGLSSLCFLSVLLLSAYLICERQRNERVERHMYHVLFERDSAPNFDPQITTQSNISLEPSGKELFNTSDISFMLALSYADQITGSVASLFSHQCLASALHPSIRVVEPFLDESVLGVDSAHRDDSGGCEMPLYHSNGNGSPTSVRLTDVYSAEHWSEASKEMAPLISWEYFIRNANRQLIVVNRLCGWSRRSSDGVSLECTSVGADKFNRSLKVFQDCYGFNIVRRVYFVSRRRYSQDDFQQLVYGDFSPRNVTVLFNIWGGIEEGPHRIQIIGAKGLYQCKRSRFFDRSNVPFSHQLKEDALKYKEKYITRDVSDEGYISVMVRLEFLHRHKLRRKSKTTILSTLNHVYSEIMKQVEVFRAARKIQNVFLTVDCRQQGSLYFTSNASVVDAAEWGTRQLVASSISKFYEMLFGNTSSLTEWDDSFYSVSSFTNPGYIGQLQKYLAASGTCLITMGGGSYQATARMMFRHSHSGSDKRCFYDVQV